MRIVSGKYRGRRLKSPPSLQTRPTSDRLRETLFNILASLIEGARFLDLCAGSGAVGLEALSRGATYAMFVDQSQKICKLIGANLESLDVPSNDSDIVCSEATEFLRRHAKNKSHPFDIVFFDPPYSADYENTLGQLGNVASSLLASDGIVVVEHYHKNELNEEFGPFRRYRELKQGDSRLSFYQVG